MNTQKMTFSTFKELTKLEFSLFGLPFVLGGALLPFASFEFFARFQAMSSLRFLLLIPGFVAARSAGMAFNQLIDSRIDAKNERTANRLIPSGRTSEKQAGMVAWTALLSFLIIAACINKCCFLLSIAASFLIVFYSYTKRITAACHFVLGAIHFLAPVMAAALISGKLLPAACFLGLVAFFSIAANDIAYALQDRSFDLQEKLYSIPAKLGISKTLCITRTCHAGVIISYLLMAKSAAFPRSTYLCAVIVGFIYWRFHRNLAAILKKQLLSQINALFFTTNVAVPALMLGYIVWGVIWSSA